MKRALIFSSVDGGPMQRLADALSERGHSTALFAQHTADTWRGLMGRSRWTRVRARLESMALYPMRSVLRALRPGDETVVVTTNPFFLPAAMVLTKPLHGRRVVALLYDLWPDAIEAAGRRPQPLVAAAIRALNRIMLRRADHIVFIGEFMAAHVLERYGQSAPRTILETGAVAGEFDEPPPLDAELESWIAGRTVASYVGNLGAVHDWDTLSAGLEQLCRSELPVAVLIAASGPGAAELQRRMPVGSERHVRFIGPQSDTAWRALMARTDIALVTLRDEARHTSVPSKAFSAMAAGSAIVAIAPRQSDLASIVERAECGAVVQPGNAVQFFDALAALVRDRDRLESTAQRGVLAVAEHYDIGRLAQLWAELLWSDSDPTDRSRLGYDRIRELLDRVVGIAGLVAVAPLMAAVAAAIRATMGTPVLFRQRRPGQGGAPFELLKFRTMRDPRPDEQGPEHDAARITRLGALLRKTSLDELPTLINVARGEMGLVGPRPLLTRYLDRYTEHQSRRHEVRPGVTGLAQVRGRNALSWEDKFEYDVWYVDNRSLWLDLRILAETALVVLNRSGINSDGHATMPEFLGSASERTAD